MNENSSGPEGSKKTATTRGTSRASTTASTDVSTEPPDEAVDGKIKQYLRYRTDLHGLAPEWQLPPLDSKVASSFPGIG